MWPLTVYLRHGIQEKGGKDAMKDEFQKALNELSQIRTAIETKDIAALSADTAEWKGADLVVTSDPKYAARFYEEYNPCFTFGPRGLTVTMSRYTLVLTRYARQLSWLMVQFRNSILDFILQFMTKYEFYAIMGDAANKYLRETPPYKQMAKDLVLFVLDDAEDLVRAIKRTMVSDSFNGGFRQ